MSVSSRLRRSRIPAGWDSAAGFSLVELVAFMAVIVVLAAFVLPFTRSTLGALNLGHDARALSAAVALAKMRAAADFTQARARADLTTGTFQVERWVKAGTPGWVAEGTVTALSAGSTFGFAGLATAPPSTQAAIAQAPACLDDAGAEIAGTACIVFNSRGVPVDETNAPFGGGAIYINDGAAVFSVTASAGGLVRLWRAYVGDATWALH
jgi:Tfp pilus assembly protein FimT